ncbi:hypothetical protein EVAR_18948_1 [Eumeta japonica]|uniref:Uncharacterized protein n=1 Tax=Eumeta variegata TaxID=151549 RepID=A0A4C1V1X5_EUMVA|nr:hypothetical protein EVAR_18948_1 [Eumeta japonica]
MFTGTSTTSGLSTAIARGERFAVDVTAAAHYRQKDTRACTSVDRTRSTPCRCVARNDRSIKELYSIRSRESVSNLTRDKRPRDPVLIEQPPAHGVAPSSRP